MPLHTANLSKIIRIAYADTKSARSFIYDDVSDYIRKEKLTGKQSGGGDFHGVLWAAFKDCIFEENTANFDQIVEALINPYRKRLYPLLAAGLKSWALEKRRWMNEEIKRIKNPIGTVTIEDKDVAFKVQNILALEIVGKGNRYIYPYFSEKPALSDEAARVALWQLHRALPNIDIEELRILDVMRGKSFSVTDVAIQGNEHELFTNHVSAIIEKWDQRYQERKDNAA